MNKPICIVGSGNGRNFADNSRELYLFISKNKHKIRPIWLTRSQKVKSEIQDMGHEVYFFYSIRGVFYALNSKIIILSNSFADVSIFSYLVAPKGKLIAQLWHGTPLKKIDKPIFGRTKKIFIRIFLSYIGRDCDFVISSTEQNIPIYRKVFRIPQKDIIVTGQPRNDALFVDPKESGRRKKQIWYMPTFREYDASFDFFDNYKFNPSNLNKVLGSSNAVLNIKLHPVNSKLIKSVKERVENYKNIKVSTTGDTYLQLASSYALITDYSSIFFDYLLLNKPIIFSPFDYKQYKEMRDFYYDYHAVTPGPKAYNWLEVEKEIKKLLDGKDRWKKNRMRIAREFNTYIDSKSSERVLDEIYSRL